MQPTVNTTRLAEILDLTKGRISQLVADGTLKGCFTGEGRARRFDIGAAAEAMGRKLDPGQRLGNGAAAAAAAARIAAETRSEQRPGKPDAPARTPLEGGELTERDDDRYKLARTQKAEEETRKLRRQNAESEGQYVLAETAGREAAKLIAAEISGVEAMIRDAARAVADEFKVDFKTARSIMLKTWRKHRESRSGALDAAAASARLTTAERADDI